MASITLKVITYNIHKGFSIANRRFVLHQMREQLQRAGVDIAFLQEIQGHHEQHALKISEWPSESQFEFLADKIWSHYAYGKNAIYNAGHHGNAILSHYPFIEWQNINVSSMRRASRSLLHGIVNVPLMDTRLHVICIHLDLRAYERRRQLSILDERIKEHVPNSEPLILAGDFNDWRGQASKQLAAELDLNEVFHCFHGQHAKTFPSVRPMLPVDRIYFRGVKPTACECLTGYPWTRLSDHLPLVAEFQLASTQQQGLDDDLT